MRGYQTYQGGNGSVTGYMGKAAGLGDLEVLCDPAPLQIGNRVWDDVNGDGVQDPNEPGLSGVTVSLQGPAGTVTATTDANGQYTFASLLPNTAYTLSMPLPSGYSLPPANAASLPGTSVTSNDPISDTRDSDATLAGSTAQIAYTTGGAGQNNYGLTFGFAQTAQFGDRAWIESDTDGLASTGVITPLAGMVITATNGSNVYTTTTSANGYYSFTVPAGSYIVTYGSVPSSYGSVVPSSTPGGNSESGNEGSYQQGGNPDQSHQNNTTVTVGAGEANWTIDFAFNLPGTTAPTALPEESEPGITTVRFYLPLVSSNHQLGVAAESVPVLEEMAVQQSTPSVEATPEATQTIGPPAVESAPDETDAALQQSGH